MVPAMSVPPRQPASAVRLGQVAGVPVYLDRTWLFLAAFIAWTGWQAGRDLGTGGALAYAAWLVLGILIAVLGHEVAHALSARLLGFRVHRIVATLWGGHTAYDGTGTTPGRAAVIAVSGPVANLGLVVAGWCGRLPAIGLVLWFVALPLARGTPDVLDAVLAAVMAWILWSGATAAIRRGPYERLLARIRPEDVLDPVAVVPVVTPIGELLGLGRRVVALDERGLPTLVLPEPSGDMPDLGLLDPGTRLASLVVRIPDACVVDLPPGSSTEPVLRAMATTGQPLVVVTSAGQVQGVVTSERPKAVAGAALGHELK